MKEKEAIEILKEWIEVDRRMRDNSTESDFDKFCEEKNIAIETVLQLIEKMREECKKCVIRDDLHNYIEETEKKDREIEKLKIDNKDLLRKLRNRVKEVKKLTKYSLYKKEFSTLNKQLEKKDKIIDEMAEQLVKAHGWFYSEFDNYTKEDFKEYFYKKVEEK